MFISLFSSPSIQMCKERLTSNHSSFNIYLYLMVFPISIFIFKAIHINTTMN